MSEAYRTNKKRTIGFETKGAAIASLKAEGKTYGEIGALLGMKPKAASSLLTRHNQRAKFIKNAIEIDRNIFLDLEREAVKRNISATELAEKLLIQIVVDKLFEAVLNG